MARRDLAWPQPPLRRPREACRSGQAKVNLGVSLRSGCCPQGGRLAQHTVIEGQADDCFLVTTILPLDLASLHTPEPGQVVRRSCRDRRSRTGLTAQVQTGHPGWRPGSGGGSPVTMYWESPEKAQPHIQPRDDSPGLPLLMLSSVMSEKFDVLQILQVWSAEQVARSLGEGERSVESRVPSSHCHRHPGHAPTGPHASS